MTDPTPRAIPTAPAQPWVLWRTWQGQRSQCGTFASRAEAERARVHLSRAMPRFQFVAEFVGKAEYGDGL